MNESEPTKGTWGCLFFIVVIVGGLLYVFIRADAKVVEKTQQTIKEFGVGKIVHIFINYEMKSHVTKAILENDKNQRILVYIRDKIPLIGERWTVTSEGMAIGDLTLGSKIENASIESGSIRIN